MLRRVVSIACLAPALFLAACSSGETSSTSHNGSGGSGAGGGNPGTGGNATGGGAPWDPGGKVTTYHAKFKDVSVPMGGENTQCMTFRLDNPEAVNVRRFHTTLTQGSHHMVLYKSTATTENTVPTDCQALGGILDGEHPVFIAQQALANLELPTDTDANLPVALKMEAHQMVKLELHYFNTSSSTITVNGDIDVDTIPSSAKVTEADLAFWGTQQINIPPHGEFDTGTHFQRGIPNTKSFAVTTHEHHLGTEMRVWFGTSTEAAKGQPLADSHSWSDPPLVLLAPPVKFGPAPNGELASSDGFAYDCHWVNPTANGVQFGESVNDEMCFLWHYYYPSQGFEVCFDGICNFTK
jgi:Copper type II ascorbate-dependent monooxygenase, C-terminal domain